jgi:hypothetical protein
VLSSAERPALSSAERPALPSAERSALPAAERSASPAVPRPGAQKKLSLPPCAAAGNGVSAGVESEGDEGGEVTAWLVEVLTCLGFDTASGGTPRLLVRAKYSLTDNGTRSAGPAEVRFCTASLTVEVTDTTAARYRFADVFSRRQGHHDLEWCAPLARDKVLQQASERLIPVLGEAATATSSVAAPAVP